MSAAGEKSLVHGRNHETDLSTESGNLFKMAAKIKSERIWVRGVETGEKQTKWRQRQGKCPYNPYINYVFCVINYASALLFSKGEFT